MRGTVTGVADPGFGFCVASRHGRNCCVGGSGVALCFDADGSTPRP
jgi:hypothetical protein